MALQSFRIYASAAKNAKPSTLRLGGRLRSHLKWHCGIPGRPSHTDAAVNSKATDAFLLCICRMPEYSSVIHVDDSLAMQIALSPDESRWPCYNHTYLSRASMVSKEVANAIVVTGLHSSATSSPVQYLDGWLPGKTEPRCIPSVIWSHLCCDMTLFRRNQTTIKKIQTIHIEELAPLQFSSVEFNEFSYSNLPSSTSIHRFLAV